MPIFNIVKRPLMKNVVLFALLALAISSCVPNRKYVFLQKDDVRAKSVPVDTVVRTYTVDTFQYRIQPNDIISVRFESLTPKDFDFLNSSGSMPAGGALNIQANALMLGELVDEQGNIFYPVVGKVKVAGFTIFELQERLQQLAVQYLESPVVKVRLLNYRITILGEVNREGTISLNNNRVSMLEAIGLSGGFTDLAARYNVKLVRQKGTEVEIVYLNFLDENFINSPYYYVYQNDMLIVSALNQRPFRKYFGPNLALIVSALSLLVLTLNLTR
jgi:polysaccharide export outer membrane protein